MRNTIQDYQNMKYNVYHIEINKFDSSNKSNVDGLLSDSAGEHVIVSVDTCQSQMTHPSI